MFKNKFKKLTGLFLAAVMTLVAMPIQTLASDWGVGDNVYAAMLGNYIGSDGKTYADKYNYDYIYYKSDGSVGVATRYASTHAKLGVSKNGVTQQAICIEAGVSYSTGSSYVGNRINKDFRAYREKGKPQTKIEQLTEQIKCAFKIGETDTCKSVAKRFYEIAQTAVSIEASMTLEMQQAQSEIIAETAVMTMGG